LTSGFESNTAPEKNEGKKTSSTRPKSIFGIVSPPTGPTPKKELRMKMLLIAAALVLAPYYAQATQPQTDAQDTSQAAICQAEMDSGQDLSPACEARLSCLIDGIQNADCQTYCAQFPDDLEACTPTAPTLNAEMARRWDRHWYCRIHPRSVRCHHRSRFCDRHPFARRCRWHR
jgi:hypothetical protein